MRGMALGGGGRPLAFCLFLVGMILTTALGGAEALYTRSRGARSEYNGHRVDTAFRRDGEALHEAPNWAALVPSVTVGNVTQAPRISDQYLCPNGTHYATRHHYAPAVFGSSVTMKNVPEFLVDFILGCCEIGTFACTLPGVDRVLGCCPLGTRCAYRRGGNGANPFHSCVEEISQECGARRCNPGYVCCPGKNDDVARCVPGDARAPREEACGKPRLTRVRGYTERVGGGRVGGLTRPHLIYDRARPEALNGTLMLFRGENTTVDFALGLYRCSITRELCSINDTCALVPQIVTTSAPNGTVISTVTVQRATTCCPVDWQVCFRPGDGNSHVAPPADVSHVGGGTVGCADVASGESCCGPAICPPGGKCCMPEAAAVGAPLVTTGGLERSAAEPVCCSESDQCCYSPKRGVFCGKTINGVPCAADSRAPGVWYNQHGPISATLLP